MLERHTLGLGSERIDIFIDRKKICYIPKPGTRSYIMIDEPNAENLSDFSLVDLSKDDAARRLRATIQLRGTKCNPETLSIIVDEIIYGKKRKKCVLFTED